MIRRIVVRVATAGLLFFFIAARAFSQPAGQAVMPPAASNDAATSQSGGGSAKEAESSPQSLPFPALQGILDDYASLRAGSGYDAAGREFHMGHLKIYFRSGTLYPILTASGKEAGFLFDGSGRYIYTSEDAADRQSIEKNILANVNTNAYRDGVLSEDLGGCFFVSSRSLLDEILGPAERSSKPGPESVTSQLSRLLQKVDDADFGIDHAAALAVLDGGSGMVFGQIDSQIVKPFYFHDPTILKEEQLLLASNVFGALSARYYNVVSRQLIGEKRTQAPVQVSRLEFSLSTDNNRDAEVQVHETLLFDGSSGRLLPFGLYNHRESAVNNWRSKTRTLDVRSIKTSDGRELPYSHKYHELLVELPEAPPKGATLDLTFDLGYHFLNRKDGDQYYWFAAGGHWYPNPPWENSTRASCHWKVRTKKPYVGVAAGTLVALKEDGDSTVFEARMDEPTSGPTLFIGKFQRSEAEKNGLKVRMSIYAHDKPRAPEAYAQAASLLLDGYARLLSPYRFKEIDIVEIEEVGWFMHSPPGLILVSGQLLARVLNKTGDRLKDWNNHAFAHEIAHQWWGNLVTPASWQKDNWISESMSEYLSAIVYSSSGKNAREQTQRMQLLLDDWWQMTDMSKNSVSIYQAGRLVGDWTRQSEYQEIVYGRGPLVLHMLRTMMGNDRFFSLLKTMVTKYAGKMMSTDDFARETSGAVGQDMKWFFDQWIKEPGIPELQVSKSIIREGDRTYVAGHLKQNTAHFKKLLVPFVYQVSGGQRSAKLFMMDEPEQDFRVELPAGVSSVDVDPGHNNLVIYH